MTFPWARLKQAAIGVPILVPLVVLSVFLVRGCGTASVPLVHPPPGVTLPPETATTAPVDLTGVQLAAVDGTTTLPPLADSGTSHLSGTVNGPQGPVPAATVHVEHLVNNRSNAIDVSTDAAGHWDLPNIAGGRYRVRAFLAPTLAQAEPEIFFLTEGEQKTVDLSVDGFTGVPEVAVAFAPDPPNLGQPTSIVVRVTHRAVGSDGVVRGAPIAGASVTFNTSDGWAVTGSPTVGTNENGDATFVVECRKVGAKDISLTLRVTATSQPASTAQQVSPCIDPRSTSTTTTAPASTSTSAPATTTTSAPKPN